MKTDNHKKIKIRFLLDYMAYPVWLYDEEDDLIGLTLPSELIDDVKLDNRLKKIQDEFESLYMNNSKEFKYVGFKNETERKEFEKECEQIVSLITDKVDLNKYEIQNDFDIY